MGGFSGEKRGKSKIEVYLKYQEKFEDWEGSFDPDPKYKKFCKRQMIWDSDTGEWVLHYYLHT
jgi:hypothetical protein